MHVMLLMGIKVYLYGRVLLIDISDYTIYQVMQTTIDASESCTVTTPCLRLTSTCSFMFLHNFHQSKKARKYYRKNHVLVMHFNCRSLVLAAASGEQRPGWRLVWEYMVSCLHAATPVSSFRVKYLVLSIWCQVSGYGLMYIRILSSNEKY
ncbi:hypothetical protein EDC96DRAFT_548808 [Choanephora cucurbitarum]|nr:hypothetical protein EDC96DRAFT_548808 [Choanephora cucurbitarum]